MTKSKPLKLSKETFIPTFSKGFGNVGFLFGAGTSCEAGFPLMKGLTDNIFSQLDNNDKNIIETAINTRNTEQNTTYNAADNLPDIEILLDMLSSQKHTSGYYTKCDQLECKIRQLIHDDLKNISTPNLEHHLKFLSYIKSRIGANHTPFWVFTTNYDLLFELASAQCKISLENGFSGTILRYFDMDCLKRIKGHRIHKAKKSTVFEPHKEAHVKLYKLHGSLSWYEAENEIVETFDSSLVSDNHKKTMIYPEHTKVDATLDSPFDNLFTFASGVIGNEVKYLVSCGYSYRDKHINDRLIIPKLQSGSLKIFALFETEPDCIDKLKQHKSFNYLTKDKAYVDGKKYSEFPNDLWKFSKFVEFITQEEKL